MIILSLNENLHEQVRGLEDLVQKQNDEVGAFKDSLEQHYKEMEARLNDQMNYLAKVISKLPPEVAKNLKAD